ncbi:hypothetical protein C789_1416 [Microcystis aeruginosa FACHB-905 = DIANCHI905]|nr:hypothetical protein C789_1416 [Microcystis aeruginosa FACHB-905 = DIANCHI905]
MTNLPYFSLYFQVSQDLGDYFYLFSPFPHFPTPYTPHPTPYTLHPTSHLRLRLNFNS